MEKGRLEELSFSAGSEINCEYTDTIGKIRLANAVVKSVAHDHFVLLLNNPDSTATLPLGKELFLITPNDPESQADSHKFVSYVIDEDPAGFPLLTVTPPIERPKTAATQSFYCNVKLPLQYFINKIEFSGEVINLSVVRFFAVVDYNPELNPGMMINFQLGLPSKIYTNLVGEILRIRKLKNNQMATVVNFLNTHHDLQSAIVKYLFQRQHELTQSKQCIVIEPKKSTRKTNSGPSFIDEQEIGYQLFINDPEDESTPAPKTSSVTNPKERYPSPVNNISDSPGVFPGKQSVCYAGFWNRGIALLLDLLILTIGGAAITIIFAVIIMMISHTSLIGDTWSRIFTLNQSFLTGFSIIVWFAFYWIYFTAMESSQRQATFGKRAFGLIVTTLNGKPIYPGVAGKRALLRIISGVILLFGFIMAGLNPKKQALHDLLSGTIVVKEDR